MITQYDLKLMLQLSIKYEIKIEVLKENGQILDTIKGVITGGNSTVDSLSSIRRTFSATVIPTLFDRDDTKISEHGLIWINKDIRVYIGVFDLRKREYIYYPHGYYVYSSTSGTYDAVTNQLKIDCRDHMSKLDGTKNGQLGSLITRFPAYEENPTTGEVIKYNIIREAVITVLSSLTSVRNYLVDDIGEHKALPQYNDDWQQYRINNPLWNTIPFDIELSGNYTVHDILNKFLELHANCEMYFDVNNTFIFHSVPGCYKDDVIFNNDFLQSVFISENLTLDMTKVRNICEVWGKVIDADFYTENCNYQNNVYTCSIEGYDEKYYNGDLIAVKIPSVNLAGAKININNLGTIDILDENTDLPVENNVIEENTVFVFKIKSRRINSETVYSAYLLGHWQAHGLNVLTDGTTGEDFIFPDGIRLPKYSKEYFQKRYNCESVEFEIIQNSPFTVQKIGEILDKKSGGEFDNITSDSLALARAKWENWKNARLTDNITLVTKLIPFYDVNIKVSYQNSKSDIEEQYIIKSVNNDFESWTSTLMLVKFYPLYDDIIKEMGTYKVLEDYKYGVLNKYTYEDMAKMTGGGKY